MDKEKIESTKASLETHKHYMETLERIQTMLKKNKISVKKVYALISRKYRKCYMIWVLMIVIQFQNLDLV